MTGALSENLRVVDARTGYVRPGRSIAHRFDDVTDADIRNLVEGFRTEVEVIAEAERAFNVWWQGLDAGLRLGMDGFAMWRSYKEGRLSMARELGHLPPCGIE